METLYIILLILCLIFSAFFSSSETAFISLQRFRLENLLASKVKGAERLVRMLEKPERLLSTILLGNTLVNTAASVLATVLVVAVLGEKSGVVVATIGMTLILLVFCEATPKIVAARHNERLAIVFSQPLQSIALVLNPFVLVLSWIASAFTRMAGETKTAKLLVSEEEIRTMISVGEEKGVVEEETAEMMHKIFEFGDRPVREVMVPRLEVTAIEKGARISDYMALYSKSPFSRFPVYAESMDNIVGMLAEKDVLMGLSKGTINRESTIDELIKPIYFTPESKIIDELLVEMRKNNHRMAIVIDEFGGMAGIVSLNGLVEEIVGPVRDELGIMDKEYEVIDEHNFQVVGSMRVDEANDAMELNLPEGEDYETVAGLVLKLLGHIPKEGDCLRHKGWRIMITRMQGMKIEELLITKVKQDKETESGKSD